MVTERKPLTFLTLPPEIRNSIYALLFIPPVDDSIPEIPDNECPIAKALLPDDHDPKSYDDGGNACDTKPTVSKRPPSHLDILLTCRQIHREAQLPALSTTIFHLHSTIALPEAFALRSQSLSTPKLGALRHLTLTARITQLRALNETWNGRPFGQSSLQLETLTLVPLRPNAANTAWAEVAELDQCHTLAHVLAETLKKLSKVEEVRVVNKGCFGDTVWPLVYRHLVFKVWKWGGMNCGVRVDCSRNKQEGWFKAYLDQPIEECCDRKGRDACIEAFRLMGAEGTNPNAVAGMPWES